MKVILLKYTVFFQSIDKILRWLTKIINQIRTDITIIAKMSKNTQK